MTTASPAWRRQLTSILAARLEDLPQHGGSHIVAVDGWSGSGKTSLSSWLAPALRIPCIHLDDLVPGWCGLIESVDLLVDWVLRPLTSGRDARWRRWDWERSAWGDELTLPPVPAVLVEGCGAGAVAARPWLSTLVWVDVEADERSRRLRSRRDWPAYEPWAALWADQEEALRSMDDPRPFADAIVEVRSEDTRVLPR